MGADDANEGSGAGECPGHRFVVTVVSGSPAGGLDLTEECVRCGAVRFAPSERG